MASVPTSGKAPTCKAVSARGNFSFACSVSSGSIICNLNRSGHKVGGHKCICRDGYSSRPGRARSGVSLCKTRGFLMVSKGRAFNLFISCPKGLGFSVNCALSSRLGVAYRSASLCLCIVRNRAPCSVMGRFHGVVKEDCVPPGFTFNFNRDH